MPKTSSAEAARLAQAAAIAEAAYFRAEHRNFEPGFEIDDWLEAERQILGGVAKARKPTKTRAKKDVAEASASKKATASSKAGEPKSKTAKKKKAAKASD